MLFCYLWTQWTYDTWLEYLMHECMRVQCMWWCIFKSEKNWQNPNDGDYDIANCCRWTDIHRQTRCNINYKDKLFSQINLSEFLLWGKFFIKKKKMYKFSLSFSIHFGMCFSCWTERKNDLQKNTLPNN